MAAKESYDVLSQQITITAFLFLLLKFKEAEVAHHSNSHIVRQVKYSLTQEMHELDH